MSNICEIPRMYDISDSTLIILLGLLSDANQENVHQLLVTMYKIALICSPDNSAQLALSQTCLVTRIERLTPAFNPDTHAKSHVTR